MLPAANVTARRRGHRSGGANRLAAAVLLLALLALCSLARADAAASQAGRAPAKEKKRVASALENARAEEVMERGHYTTLSAEAVAGEEDEVDGLVMPERVDLEVIQDYGGTGANTKHNPHP